MTLLSNSGKFSNEEAKTAGWGTDAWRSLLKKVLKAAKKVDGGFTVDITITAHWPTVINNIDPNDDAASQEISYTTHKLTRADLENSAFKLPLPEQRVADEAPNAGAAPFLFVDKFVSAALVKVESVSEDGNVVYDMVSIVDLANVTGKVEGAGYAAGVPDEAACEQYGINYAEVVRLFGEAPAEGADLSKSFNGKMDAYGNRARMADWQDVYASDLTAKAGLLESYQPSEGDGNDYYYLYNNPVPMNSDMINKGENEKYKSGAAVDTVVTLKGECTPYLLDAWTGEITPIAEYSVNGDGTISTVVSLKGGASAIIAIVENTAGFPAAKKVHVTSTTGGEVH